MLQVLTPGRRRPPAPDFAPVIREWMRRKFEAPTQAQALAWPAIAKGRNTLVFSPTGSGKTLAAFLWAINELVELGEEGDLSPHPYIVYVSPLRALANDVERNLLAPLAELREIAAEWLTQLPDVRVAVRTGDTPPRDRQRMLRRPPHVVITTPESLFLLLTSSFREHLRHVRYVIVDEIHYLCGDKRGAHLALSLERLEELVASEEPSPEEGAWTEAELLAVRGRWRDIRRTEDPSADSPASSPVGRGLRPPPAAEGPSARRRPVRRPSPSGLGVSPESRDREPALVRIGLSATQSPVEEVARFLVGCDDEGRERDCTIVDIGAHRNLDLQVCSPVPNLMEAKPEEVWDAIYARLLELIREHRTTLVFCNSKYWTERVAAKLNMLAEGEGLRIGAHHGSMARSFRLEMEEQLKTGALRAIVATSSLELGIDIGHLDLVCQVESPKNVASGLQRVGRAGHLLGLTSKGRLICTSRDDLVEMAVLAKAMRAGELEPVHIPTGCLDVLAQQVTAMAAIEPLGTDEVLRICRRAYSFRHTTEGDLERVLDQLAGQYESRALYEVRPRLNYNRARHRVAAARDSLKVAQQNAGTIPEYAEYAVHAEDYDKKIGTLEEQFVQRLRPGQVFVLGTKTWEFARVDRNRVYVRDGRGRAPTIPYWLGPDVIPRSFRLGDQVARFRSEMFGRLFAEPEGLREWLVEEHSCDEWAADQLVEYFLEQAHSLDTWPTRDALVVEVSRNPLGHRQMLVHSPFGGRLNEAWAESLVQASREGLGLELQATVSDNAFVLHLPPEAEHEPEQILSLVTLGNQRDWVQRYVRESAMFAIRFRHAAVRALTVLRMRQGRRQPVWRQEAAARRVEREVAALLQFPIITETTRECTEDYLDMAGLTQILGEIESGRLRVVRADVDIPSPFGHELLLGGQFGPMGLTARRERRTELLALHREVLKQILDEETIRELLDPGVVEEFEQRRQGAHPMTRARDAEELLRLIVRCGELSEEESSPLHAGRRAAEPFRPWLAALWQDHRVVPVCFPGATTDDVRWIAAEEFPLYARAFAAEGKETHAESEILEAVRRAGETTTEELEQAAGGQAAELTHRLWTQYRLVRGGREEGQDVWALPGEWLPASAPQSLNRLAARREVLQRALRGWGPLGVSTLAARYGLTVKLTLAALRPLLETGEIQQGDFMNGRDRPQVCTRANLEELHRLVLARMRQEIEPVEMDRYQDFLLKWQHVHPRHNLQGPAALGMVVEQQAGFRAYALLWERDVLGMRTQGLEPREVGIGVHRGELVYGQFAAGAGPVRPLLSALTFLPAGRAADLVDLPTTEGLARDELAVLRAVREQGPLPLPAITERAQINADTADKALWRLFRRGLVTNSDYGAVARCRWTHPPRWEREVLGGEALGEDDDGGPGAGGEPDPEVAEADLEAAADLRRARLRADRGQWLSVHALADDRTDDASVGRRCRARALTLIGRYGVAAREVLLAKSGISPADLSRGLRELFLRGQLLRGFFIKGLSGDQFALPAGLEQLRREKPAENEPMIMLSSLDPAALHLSVVKLPDGISRPLASRYVVLRRGQRAAIVDCRPGEGRFFAVRDMRLSYPEELSGAPLAAFHKQLALAVVEYAARWGQQEGVRISRIDGVAVDAEPPVVSDFVAAGYVLRHGQLRYRLRKRVGVETDAEPLRRVVRTEEAKHEDLHPTSKPVLDFYQYVINQYVPPADRDMLVFFQCSVSRPYSKSPSHSPMRKAIRLATGKDPKDEGCRCHVVVMSSVIGPVPYDMEDVYPATERGGGVKHMGPEEYRFAKPILAERMAAYIRKWHGRYRIITTFTHDRYGDVMEAARRIAGVDFRVLPQARGLRMPGGGAYWGKFWVQLFHELLGGMTEQEQEAALERLAKEDAIASSVIAKGV